MKFMKIFCCVTMLCIVILFPTITYGKDAYSIDNYKKDNIEENRSRLIENNTLLDQIKSVETITPDKLKKFSRFADIQIAKYEDDRVEYTFIPEKIGRIEDNEDRMQLSEYEIIKLTAVPNNQKEEIDLNSTQKASYGFEEGDSIQESIIKNHSDVKLRGIYNYTEGIAKEPGAKVKVAKLNWISGCVVKRTERFGKDLKLYADASGDRVDSKGKTIKVGKEKTSVKTIVNPKIGTTYKLTTNFKYYYSLSTVGNIHGSVTYQLSHNGKTYYKVSNIFNKGNFRA